jgi:hypothetical protein
MPAARISLRRHANPAAPGAITGGGFFSSPTVQVYDRVAVRVVCLATFRPPEIPTTIDRNEGLNAADVKAIL